MFADEHQLALAARHQHVAIRIAQGFELEIASDQPTLGADLVAIAQAFASLLRTAQAKHAGSAHARVGILVESGSPTGRCDASAIGIRGKSDGGQRFEAPIIASAAENAAAD